MNLSRDAKKSLLALVLSLLAALLFVVRTSAQEPTPEVPPLVNIGDAAAMTIGTPSWDDCTLEAEIAGGDPAGHFTAPQGKAACFVLVNAPSFLMMFYQDGHVLDSYHVAGLHTGVVRWWRSCDPARSLYGCPVIKNVYVYTRPDQHYLHFFPLMLRDHKATPKTWAYP